MYPSCVKRSADFISVPEMEGALEEWAHQGVGPVPHRESISSYWRYKKSITEYDKQVYAWTKSHLTVFTPRHKIKPAIRRWWVWGLGWIGAWVFVLLALPMISVILKDISSIEVEDFLFGLWVGALFLFPLVFIVGTPVYKYFGGPTHRNALKVDNYEFSDHVRAAVQLMDEEDLLLFTQAVIASNGNPVANDVAVTLVRKYSPRVQARATTRRKQIAADAKATAQHLQMVAEQVERAEIQTEVEKELEKQRWQAIKDGLG